jgi:hypothetical protein
LAFGKSIDALKKFVVGHLFMTAPDISPAQYDEYNAIANACLENLVQVLDATDWTVNESKPNFTLSYRYVAGSSFMMIKAETNVSKPVEAVVKRLCTVANVDSKTPEKDRDGAIERTFYLAEPNEFNDGFLYLALDSGSRLVSHRDFVLYRKHYERDGVHYFVSASVINDAIAKEKKGFVRGKIICQGYMVDQSPTDPAAARLRFVAHADPSGSVPGFVYNAVCSKQGYTVIKVRDEVQAE